MKFRKRDLKKMTDDERENGRTRFSRIRARQKAHGDSLREWMQQRNIDGEKAAKARQIELNSLPRGRDRVPENMRGPGGVSKGEVLVEHYDSPYRERRAQAIGQGLPLRPGMNQPLGNFNPKGVATPRPYRGGWRTKSTRKPWAKEDA